LSRESVPLLIFVATETCIKPRQRSDLHQAIRCSGNLCLPKRCLTMDYSSFQASCHNIINICNDFIVLIQQIFVTRQWLAAGLALVTDLWVTSIMFLGIIHRRVHFLKNTTWRLSRHFSGKFLFLVLAPQGVLLLSRCDVFLDISLVQDPICVELYQLNFSLALTDDLWCAYFMNPLCNWHRCPEIGASSIYWIQMRPSFRPPECLFAPFDSFLNNWSSLLGAELAIRNPGNV
jgi:hypothetical protein